MLNPPRPLGSSGGSIAHLREHNLSRILLALASETSLSRAQIAARTGLGITAMTKLIAELRGRELAIEVPDTSPGAIGRPSHHIALADNRWSTASLNLDNGAIHVATGGIAGEYDTSYSIRTPESLEIDEYMNYVAEALNHIASANAKEGKELLALEVAVPGAVNRASGVMMRSILNGWSRQYPLRKVLLDLLQAINRGIAPTVLVGIDRATNYSLLARLRDSPARTQTGTVAHLGGLYAVSGGIYSRSALEHGSTGLAGEFGHFVVDPTGAQCWCGRRGCVETRIGLASLYTRCNGEHDSAVRLLPQLALRHEHFVRQILSRAEAGDELVLRELNEAGRWLGITVDTIATIVNPGALLIDGYLSALAKYLEPEMTRQLESVGPVPAISGLGIAFAEEPFTPVNRGMQIAAGLAVAMQPGAVRGPRNQAGKAR